MSCFVVVDPTVCSVHLVPVAVLTLLTGGQSAVQMKVIAILTREAL